MEAKGGGRETGRTLVGGYCYIPDEGDGAREGMRRDQNLDIC